jgi:hypothetical protein
MHTTPGPRPAEHTVQVVDWPHDAPAQEAATEGVRRLFQAVFAHEMTTETWAWKYRQAPGSQVLHWLALDEAGWPDPCGHVGCLMLPGRWQGRPAWMAHLTDVMVHPRARAGLEAHSVYGRLMRAMAQGLAERNSPEYPVFAYGFPGRLPSRLGQRMGLYRPIRLDERQPVWTYTAPGPAAAAPSRPWRSQLHHWSQAIRVQRVDPADTAAWAQVAQAGLAAAKGHGPQPRLCKDLAFLRWRYTQHPRLRYTVWSVAACLRGVLGWVVTVEFDPAWIIDAQLPQLWQEGAAWTRVLQALSQATGVRQWRTWQAGSDQCPGSLEPSLIVPGEFRFRELAGGPATAVAAAFPGAPAATPRFQPGDTDVF